MWLELELSERKLFSKKGKEYTYWEAGFTVGFDPGAGKQIQRSIIGKTQKKVVQKLRQLISEIDHGIYKEPCKLTVKEWPGSERILTTSKHLQYISTRQILSYISPLI